MTVFDQQTQRKIRSLSAGDSAAERNGTWLAWTTVEGLSQRTSYIIRVQARNKAGLSKGVVEKFVKTRGAFGTEIRRWRQLVKFFNGKKFVVFIIYTLHPKLNSQ